jgi:hypothetical protein
MLTQKDINTKLQRLGAIRGFIANKLWGALYEGEEELDASLEEIRDHQEAFMLLAMSIGISIDGNEVLPKLEIYEKPTDFILENTVLDENLSSKIEKKYGYTPQRIFSISQAIMAIKPLCMYQHTDLKNTPKERKELIKSQREMANVALKSIGEMLEEETEFIVNVLEIECDENFLSLSNLCKTTKKTKATFKQIDEKANALVNRLIPEYTLISERLEKAKQIIYSLKICKPGIQHWKQYEEVCIDALNFIFVPPFKTVIPQQSTSDGHERRDAIIPNNQTTGFWKFIREEFQSRHIVCEFKNKSETLSKKDVEQLRIYLSNKSLGRFGLLFSRKYPSSSVLTALRQAYEQADILILVINDRVLESLIKIKSFMGDPNDLLEYHKNKFELNY